MGFALQVECYAGHKADERPLRFRFLSRHGGHDRGCDKEASRLYEIREVLDQWYGVGYQCFKVRADDNNLYILRHNTKDDLWTLDSFRHG